MHRLLPLLFISAVILAVYFYLPLKRELTYRLHLSGDNTTSCCSIPQVGTNLGSFDEDSSIAVFDNQILDYPKTSLAQNTTVNKDSSKVLGTSSDKWIEVSLSEQKLRAWEGNRIIREFLISSGRWFPTPIGDFHIWLKTRFQKMVGGKKELGTYYDLPNVPYNMFFYQGFAVHGTYWHNNFGHPMSHGCVNTPTDQAAWLFNWSGPNLPPDKNYVVASANNPGTRVFIH